MNRRWNKEEEDFLKSNYIKMGATNCASYLNRTVSSVENKVNRLKLKGRSLLKSNEQYDDELFQIESSLFRVGDYLGAHVAIEHNCVEGHAVRVTPSNTLAGKGCGICASNRLRNTETFTEAMRSKGINYTLESEYINSQTPAIFRCDKNHTWSTAPNNILNNGTKCPYCTKTGFDPNKPGILYYLKLNKEGQIAYKIGITNRTIEKRFKQERGIIIDILHEELFEDGHKCMRKEVQLLSKYPTKGIKHYLKTGGNSELYEYDVLNLDKQK